MNLKEKNMNCPFCEIEAPWVENKEIYGKNYGKSYMCYYCKPCNAYVGCHENSERPLGTMADKETREWRKKVHAYIDPFWKTGAIKRGALYAFLTEKLGRSVHVGESSVEQCKEILNVKL